MYNDARHDGLYDPATESDACGVGAVCTLHDPPSHRIVRLGLEVLLKLDHRGACGCDPDTGDGAGILVGLPDAFFRAWAADHGRTLPPAGDFAVGMLFLPQDDAQRRVCMIHAEAALRRAGVRVVGWRRVPTRPEAIGATSRAQAPAVWQVVAARGEAPAGDGFERALYLARKRMERAVRASALLEEDLFYVVSLSARTLVYKGMLTPAQVPAFYPDLEDPRMESRLAVVHSRFSTNTLPHWRLAQPFRFLCHNGEINTLRGNVNGMRVREALLGDGPFGADAADLRPVLREGDSDSAALDGAVELLRMGGRSLPHALAMLIPEAWEGHDTMSDARRAFYAYHSLLMEPWDGPATVPFTDGRYLGAVLDRNGLRPSRFAVTDDGLVVLASEAGVLDLDPASVVRRGRLRPGRMFLVDLDEGRLIEDEEIKERLAARRPYGAWLEEHLRTEHDLPEAPPPAPLPSDDRLVAQRRFGYTAEDLRVLLAPMAEKGKEALGSMGDDTPLAVLSDRPRLLYDYFRQLFAQVTNPPLDAIREALVTSLHTDLGAEGDLFDEAPEHARRLRLPSPVLSDAALAAVRALEAPGLSAATLPIGFDPDGGGEALSKALDALGAAAEEAVGAGRTILILSDRALAAEAAPIPALLAVGSVHHGLIRAGLRGRCALVVESGEPREVHHLCTLVGYGAHAVNPYLALATVRALAEDAGKDGDAAESAYLHAAGTGILKVMSKMGISTLHSYRGAQVFEAVGLSRALVGRHFAGTPSRIGGVGLDVLAAEAAARHDAARRPTPGYHAELDAGGRYAWRRGGERHAFEPLAVARLQHAVRARDAGTYDEWAAAVNGANRAGHTLRGLLDFTPADPVPIDEVEPWTRIVRRFKTGAMSYGSISKEAHEALAVAMNRIGGRSNTGEGGEDPARYDRASPRRSRIKQVASGRFGVTAAYLASADEIQIKMAQGAKPGEGGQLPGEKVYPWIAETRHATPWVGLISPPPHHDIYSIEDLAQLIHDLKNANPAARVTVKLVSEVGVGTVAVGVAKGKADVVLISGHDGGTGASPQTSVMHAGLPWELGLAEANQALVRAGLRSRIRVECDGGLKTGRDVAVAALLGADEFGFATAPLVALGCVMMRKCHLNTCPVGIATQNPVLRERFAGEPEHVVNYLHFVAEELRAVMASLGFRTVDEMVGRADRLAPRTDVDHPKARHLDLAPLVAVPEVPEHLRTYAAAAQDHGLAGALDHDLIARAAPALSEGRRVRLDVALRNTNRTVGTMLSGEVVKRRGDAGLPDDTIRLRCTGAAGQSFFAFGAAGLTAVVEGEANDYFGKGLSGARLVLRPPRAAGYRAEDQTILGNVALYGATSGEVYVRGRAGERFAVRNSGVRAVVEGVGDHGCEYMTGGCVVVLGRTGRNFAAGMSGGTAYVLDPTGAFRARRCNRELVDLEPMEAQEDVDLFLELVARHHGWTESPVAAWVLDHPAQVLPHVVKVMPVEYRRALERLREEDDARAA